MISNQKSLAKSENREKDPPILHPIVSNNISLHQGVKDLERLCVLSLFNCESFLIGQLLCFKLML